MRDIKITYNHIKNIRARAETIIKDLDKRELLDPKIEEEICSAKSLDALDHLVNSLVFSRFRSSCYLFFGILSSMHRSNWPANHHCLNELKLPVLRRPLRNCCMNRDAHWILHNLWSMMLTVVLRVWKRSKRASKTIYLTFLAKTSMCWSQFKICTKTYSLLSQFCWGTSQNDRIFLLWHSNRLSRPNNGIKIETSQNTKASKSNKDDNPQANSKRVDKNDDPRKFEIYFKFQAYFNSIQSHQTLAINRGENLKVKRKTMIDVGTVSVIFRHIFLFTVFVSQSCHTGSYTTWNLPNHWEKILQKCWQSGTWRHFIGRFEWCILKEM